jgi:hypothetical protein
MVSMVRDGGSLAGTCTAGGCRPAGPSLLAVRGSIRRNVSFRSHGDD